MSGVVDKFFVMDKNVKSLLFLQVGCCFKKGCFIMRTKTKGKAMVIGTCGKCKKPVYGTEAYRKIGKGRRRDRPIEHTHCPPRE